MQLGVCGDPSFLKLVYLHYICKYWTFRVRYFLLLMAVSTPNTVLNPNQSIKQSINHFMCFQRATGCVAVKNKTQKMKLKAHEHTI